VKLRSFDGTVIDWFEFVNLDGSFLVFGNNNSESNTVVQDE
jgi:hypothetical protein